jgi:hypothetical protein
MLARRYGRLIHMDDLRMNGFWFWPQFKLQRYEMLRVTYRLYEYTHGREVVLSLTRRYYDTAVYRKQGKAVRSLPGTEWK